MPAQALAAALPAALPARSRRLCSPQLHSPNHRLVLPLGSWHGLSLAAAAAAAARQRRPAPPPAASNGEQQQPRGGDDGPEPSNLMSNAGLFLLWAALTGYAFFLSPNQTPLRDSYFLEKLVGLGVEDGVPVSTGAVVWVSFNQASSPSLRCRAAVDAATPAALPLLPLQ